MDYKIVFSEPSIEDLESIVRFIAQDNPQAAAQFGAKLIKSVQNLATFPRFGRVIPEKDDENIREIIFKSYRVFLPHKRRVSHHRNRPLLARSPW